MKYRIKINDNNGGSATVTIFEQGIDFAVTLNPIEQMKDFLKRVDEQVEKEIKAQVKVKKVSLPNPVVKEVVDDDKTKIAQAKYYEGRDGYEVKEFLGGKGSGRSTRAGEYQGKNNLIIHKVFNLSDREIWVYKKR